MKEQPLFVLQVCVDCPSLEARGVIEISALALKFVDVLIVPDTGRFRSAKIAVDRILVQLTFAVHIRI